MLFSLIESDSVKYNLTADRRTTWFDTIKANIEERISDLKLKLKFNQSKPILQDEEVLDCLMIYRKHLL